MSKCAYPYPGDYPIARARRVARAYRARLEKADPDGCAELDALVRRWGESAWLVPQVVRFSDDDWLTVAEAADVMAVKADSIHKLRSRGRLKGRLIDGRWHYQWRELMTVISVTRKRQSLPDS